MVPNSVRSSDPNCDNKTLDVNEYGQLIAGANCTDEALDGASFKIQRDMEQVEIVISTAKKQVGAIGQTSFPGYIFRKLNDPRSLCTSGASLDFQKKKFGLRNEFEAWKYLEDPIAGPHIRDITSRKIDIELTIDNDNDIAIVFPGEVRGENAETIPNSQQSGWFNIACIRDALAKIDLDVISPHETTPEVTSNYYNKRTAALKMITANYCNLSRYTYEGNDLGWEFRISKTRWSDQTPKTPAGSVEAIWDETGALCLSHTRLFSASHRGNFPKAALPTKCRKEKLCRDEPSIRNELWLECPLANHSCNRITQGYFRSRSP